MAQKWSILDQNWPNMAGLSTFQSGPKGAKMNNPNVFDHKGPFWVHLDSFGSLQTKTSPSALGMSDLIKGPLIHIFVNKKKN